MCTTCSLPIHLLLMDVYTASRPCCHEYCSNKHKCASVSAVCWFRVLQEHSQERDSWIMHTLIFRFWSKLFIDLHCGRPGLHFQQQHIRIPLLFVVDRMRWILYIILTWISLMTKDVESFLKSVLAVCVFLLLCISFIPGWPWASSLLCSWKWC